MNDLENEIKELIISSLNLEDISVDDIASEEALFGDGLGLDSIDALELGIALQQKYNVNFKSDSEDTRKHFYSVKTLAQFINSESQK
ncbi:MAG: phosphopantetheine-binding protein [Lentisphaeraceae bacterium]|nr:phosphopantetheine-binding protein [Lentisphaeraceae bacterium]